MSEREALPFNLSALRAAKRGRLARLEQMRGPDTTAEQMAAVILGAKYVEG